MVKKAVSKVVDKLRKVNESFTVNMYDNGYMVEVSGQNTKGDYATVKILCQTPEELVALVNETIAMERE